MTTMNVIAKVGDLEVIRELNGTIVVKLPADQYICDTTNAYEAIKRISGIDDATRAELLRQWSTSMGGK